MELRATFQIPTLIKAMDEVVLPAVDPSNKLAVEQAQLIAGSLKLMQQRLTLQYRYDRRDLESFVELADQIGGHADGVRELQSLLPELQSAVVRSRDVLERARAEPVELEDTGRLLRQVIANLIKAAANTTGDHSGRDAIESAALEHAKGLLERERAWLAPQGWEGTATELPPAEELLQPQPKSFTSEAEKETAD